jgi:hypothetical protein
MPFGYSTKAWEYALIAYILIAIVTTIATFLVTVGAVASSLISPILGAILLFTVYVVNFIVFALIWFRGMKHRGKVL